MQEYRSGHNEAVLKTVRPKATGVRIPLPAPKIKHQSLRLVLLFLLRYERILTPLCDSTSRRMGVRIPHPKIEELALQTQGVGIFAKGEYPSYKPFDKLEFINLMSCDSACDFSPIHNGYGRVNALLYENELSRRACV